MKNKKTEKQSNLDKLASGIITGCAGNDPSGITVYTITGAVYGLAQGWLMVLSLPLLVAVQSSVAKIGMVTGMGLGEIIRKYLPYWVGFLLMILYAFSTWTVVGADLLAMGDSLNSIFDIPRAAAVLILSIGLFSLLVRENFFKIRKVFLFLSLFYLLYVVVALLTVDNWFLVLEKIFTPNIDWSDPAFLNVGLAMLGTTISPYMLFWEVEEEGEEEHSRSEMKDKDKLLLPGMVYSQFITLFVIIASSFTLHVNGVLVETSKDAAMALGPIAGSWSSALYSFGIVTCGLLAVPVLVATVAAACVQFFGLGKSILTTRFRDAKAFYSLIGLGLLAGPVMQYFDIDPIKALFSSQVIYGFVMPVLLIFVYKLGRSKKVMGRDVVTGFDRIFLLISILVFAFFAITSLT